MHKDAIDPLHDSYNFCVSGDFVSKYMMNLLELADSEACRMHVYTLSEFMATTQSRCEYVVYNYEHGNLTEQLEKTMVEDCRLPAHDLKVESLDDLEDKLYGTVCSY